MPRPPSDLVKVSLKLSPEALDQLDRIARARGWETEGKPSRSRAVRELAALEAARLDRAGRRYR